MVDNQMVIAIDFDGTICKQAWPNIGAPIPGAAEAIKALSKAGHKLILWTCREKQSLNEALNWLTEMGISYYFDQCNSNTRDRVSFFGGDPRKIGADLYIDDKAVGCPKIDGMVDWDSIMGIVDQLAKNIREEEKGQ